MNIDWNMRDVAKGKTVITTIDAQTAGEPLRIVTGGFPEIPGATMLDRRRYARKHLDHLRRALMHEPRGHYDMYGAIPTPPVSPEADLGVLFMHNEGFSTMCGHGIFALVTVLLETGAIPVAGAETPIAIDTPAGQVRAAGLTDGEGRVEKVSLQNVPSFVLRRDVEIEVQEVGRVMFDLAFGGAFYAILPVTAVGQRVLPQNCRRLVEISAAIKSAANEQVTITHPVSEELAYLYAVIFTDEPEDPAHHSRNLCVFANSEVDRSPTGTGVSARLAVHFARHEIEIGQTIAVESIMGSQSVFEGRVLAETTLGDLPAINTEVSGSASITGRHEFLLDPQDPLGPGFVV